MKSSPKHDVEALTYQAKVWNMGLRSHACARNKTYCISIKLHILLRLLGIWFEGLIQFLLETKL